MLLALLLPVIVNRSFAKLIFYDDFKHLDFDKWTHDNTLAGGGNWEFQWYTNNRTNSFVKDGILYIKPTLTADQLGEAALSSATLDINGVTPADACTSAAFYGCSRKGTHDNILNPVKSALLRTSKSFAFRYGRVEVRAKMPAGDWLWPAIWMLPKNNAYGGWPTSGEIDIVESRGNRNLIHNGMDIGVQRIESTLHWGPNPSANRYTMTNWPRHNSTGFDQDFHVYELDWTSDSISFRLDGVTYGTVRPGRGGFWEYGGFANGTLANPWVGGSKMAPFDKEFYLIFNVAVGGVGYFPDDAVNMRHHKPWHNSSPRAAKEFWDARADWLPTWDLKGGDTAALQIDYVKVYKY